MGMEIMTLKECLGTGVLEAYGAHVSSVAWGPPNDCLVKFWADALYQAPTSKFLIFAKCTNNLPLRTTLHRHPNWCVRGACFEWCIWGTGRTQFYNCAKASAFRISFKEKWCIPTGDRILGWIRQLKWLRILNTWNLKKWTSLNFFLT